MPDQNVLQIMTIGFSLALLAGLETWFPFRAGRERSRHAARNLFLGIGNAALVAITITPLLMRIADRAETTGIGLLRMVTLPPWLQLALAILLLDGWMYLWHRANHRLPLLWRFHQAHHSDTELDVTSAVRFHTGEILLSGVLRLALVPLLGLSLWQVFLYDALLAPFVLWQHGNVRLPERVDELLRLVFTTPAMHRTHHSQIRRETDSNYASIFSFWDRLGRTMTLHRDMRSLTYGLSSLPPHAGATLSSLLRLPFMSMPR
ncbi:MAG: sterol desaturase family protein [Blastocatellia bacterium]